MRNSLKTILKSKNKLSPSKEKDAVKYMEPDFVCYHHNKMPEFLRKMDQKR